MKLSSDEVRAIAAEARLSLSDEELPRVERYMNDFLEMVDRFKELDLKNVDTFKFAEISECPLREDIPEPFPRMDEILAERGMTAGSFFKVPRIMEE